MMETLSVDSKDSFNKTHTVSKTKYEYFGCSEQPRTTRTNVQDQDNNRDTLQTEGSDIQYIKFDTKTAKEVTNRVLILHHDHEQVSRAQQGFDANGNVNGKFASQDELPPRVPGKYRLWPSS